MAAGQLKARILAAAAVVASSLVGRRARPGAHVRRHGRRAGLRGGVRRRVCFRLPLLLGGLGSRVQACACVAARRAPPLMMRAPTCLYYDFNIGCFTWV